jgi:polyhydroxyalkanoate synthase subunit PhaE
MTDTTPKSQNDFAQFWQNLAQQNLQTWMSGATPTAQTAAHKMVENQQAMMNLMTMAMKAWQNLLPTFDKGGDWQAALAGQMEQLRQELLKGGTANVRTMNNMGDLWQTYLKEWQGFATPWFTASQKGMEFNASAMAGDRSALMELIDLYWDAYQDTFGKLLQSPGLGSNREFDEKLRKGFAAWLDMQEAMYEYQVVVADTWVKAFEQLMQEIVGQAEKGKAMSLRDFLNQWSGTADNIFKAAFASEAYITVQSKLVNMMMSYRIRQREIMESTLQSLDLPTRSEVDEAHRRIYELRKEIKALREEIAALKGDSEPKASTPAPRTPATRRKTTAAE